MNMLKEMEERKLKEREEDKKERKAVADEIKEGVKKEMQEVMKPWQERTVRVEESTAEMGEEVKRLAAEMRELKEQLTRKNDHSYASVAGSGVKIYPKENSLQEGEEEKERIRLMFMNGKKIIGLKPIDKAHVEHVKRRQAEEMEGKEENVKEEKAKEEAVKLFLKYDMKMKDEDIAELDMVKIFHPAKDDWNVLYVELGSSEQAQFAYSFTKHMKSGITGESRTEVIKYIPRDLFSRFKAVTALGHKARLESKNTINFCVSFGIEDFILQHKPKGSRGC